MWDGILDHRTSERVISKKNRYIKLSMVTRLPEDFIMSLMVITDGSMEESDMIIAAINKGVR